MVSTSRFGKQALKYLFFVFFTFFSTCVFADYRYNVSNISSTIQFSYIGSTSTHYENLTQLCTQLASKLGLSQTNISWTNNNTSGQCTRNSNVIGNWTRVSFSCPAAGTTDVKSVPFRLRNSQVCIDSCLWNPVSTAGMVCGDNSGICATDFTAAGTSCSQNSDLTPTQEDKDNTAPPETEPPQPECKNETGSDSYCSKPPQGCPSGYTEQSFNGESICVKNSDQIPNPNDPNNNDNEPPASEPNGGNDNNQGGGDVDLTPVINAINELKNILSNGINSLKEALSNGFKSVTDMLIKTNEKLDQSNEYLDEIQKESVKTNQKLDKSNEHLEKLNKTSEESKSILEQIKDFFTEEVEESEEENTKIDISDSSGSVDTTISFSGYCPAPITVPIKFAFVNTEMEFTYTRYCDLAQFLKPVVIALAAFVAALIIGGVRQGD